jgi:glycopeptide antibiotics resistance protein
LKSTLPVPFLFIFGIGIEITQELGTATRHADVFDVLANVSGAILGIVVVLLLNLKRGSDKKTFI